MKKQRIYELMDGIAEEFILEAEPAFLTDLQTAPVADTSAGGARILGTPVVTCPISRPSPRPAKRWMTAACLALAILMALPLCLGGVAMAGMGNISGGGLTSIFGPEFMGGLFPFLSPEETESQNEVTVRDPHEETDPPETKPQETQPPDPCAKGHTYEETVTRMATCYAPAKLHMTCTICGYEEEIFGETEAHVYKDGYCEVCGLVEGAVDWKYCMVYPNPMPYEGEVVGYKLETISWNIDKGHEGEIILPNVFYTEEYGLLPVTALWIGMMEGNSKVTKVVIPDTVTVIAAEAFKGCSTLTEIQLPAGLVELTDHAFSGCSSLTEVVIPEATVNLGKGVFTSCTSLERVVCPTRVDNFGEKMFWGCTALTDVTLPENLTALGDMTFGECSSLVSVTLPDSLTSIGASCFENCAALTAISLPDGITVMGNKTFMGCKQLASVKLPAALTEIPVMAFDGCSRLHELEIPEGVTKIGGTAFREAGLYEVTIPASMVEIVAGAFSGAQLREVTFAGENLRKVGEKAFYQCRFLTHIELPEGTEVVDREAFRGCYVMQYAILPNSVTTVEYAAFYGCSALEMITFPTGLKKLGDDVLESCPKLSSLEMDGEGTYFVAVNNCLIRLEDGMLWYGTSASVIPEGLVKIIRHNAFHARKIRELVIPEGVEKLEYDAFAGCTELVSVTLPSSLREIGSSAFQFCTRLTEVVIPEGVTTFGTMIFHGCTSLRTVTVPGSATSLPDLFFDGCTALEEVRYGANVAKWEKLSKGVLFSNNSKVAFTVYCKNGEIAPDGTVTMYE